jgi:hypothetical protein
MDERKKDEFIEAVEDIVRQYVREPVSIEPPLPPDVAWRKARLALAREQMAFAVQCLRAAFIVPFKAAFIKHDSEEYVSGYLTYREVGCPNGATDAGFRTWYTKNAAAIVNAALKERAEELNTRHRELDEIGRLNGWLK